MLCFGRIWNSCAENTVLIITSLGWMARKGKGAVWDDGYLVLGCWDMACVRGNWGWGQVGSCLCTYLLVIFLPASRIIVIPSILGGQDAHLPENQSGLIDRRVYDERFFVVGGFVNVYIAKLKSLWSSFLRIFIQEYLLKYPIFKFGRMNLTHHHLITTFGLFKSHPKRFNLFTSTKGRIRQDERSCPRCLVFADGIIIEKNLQAQSKLLFEDQYPSPLFFLTPTKQNHAESLP